MRIVITSLGALALVSSINTAIAEQERISAECCKCPSVTSAPLPIQDKPVVVNKEATIKVETAIAKPKEAKPIKLVKHEDKKIAKEKKIKKKVSSVATSKSSSTVVVTSRTFDTSKPREGFYLEAKGGAGRARKLTNEFDRFYRPKTNAVFEVRGGYNFKRFAVDLNVIHSPKNAIRYRDERATTAPDPRDPKILAGFKHNTDVKFTAIALNTYCNIMHYKGFTPYIGVGAGVSRNTLNKIQIDSDYPNPGGAYSLYRRRAGATVNNFMWQAMVGAKYLVNDNFELSLEYKFMNLGKFKTGGSSIRRGVTSQEEIQRSKLISNTFLTGVRYYF